MEKKADLESRTQSLWIALKGIKTLLIAEPNARIHASITLAVIAAAWMVGLESVEWAVLALTIGLVWTAEAFNTAVEHLLDRVHPEKHPDVKLVKDISAGGVLISAIAAVLVGISLFGPRLWIWIRGLLYN